MEIFQKQVHKSQLKNLMIKFRNTLLSVHHDLLEKYATENLCVKNWANPGIRQFKNQSGLRNIFPTGIQHGAVPFEMLVLDTAFYTITAKFGR